MQGFQPREVHKPGVPLIGEAELFEQAFGVYRFLPVKRSPEIHRLPHLDPFLELRLLELNPDAFLQLVDVGRKKERRTNACVTASLCGNALRDKDTAPCRVLPDRLNRLIRR